MPLGQRCRVDGAAVDYAAGVALGIAAGHGAGCGGIATSVRAALPLRAR
jgi:hypothetical protein